VNITAGNKTRAATNSMGRIDRVMGAMLTQLRIED